VLDEFRLHVTLTDRLADAERARVRAVLEPMLRAVEAERLSFRSICLFEQPGPGARFVLTKRTPFSAPS
jgi:hypothetical protein